MVYLDNNSTTKIDDRVLEAMLPFFRDQYYNGSSSHFYGQNVKKQIDQAREKIAALIHGTPANLIFTSGATEAINLGIKGIALSPQNEKNHIITVTTEHKAVLDTVKYLESIGFIVTYLQVDKNGLLDLEQLKHSINENTLMVAVMYVNNETGVLHDITAISNIAHEKGTLLFCDATQAVGKIPIDVEHLGVDFLSFSAHKYYGPKGVGALYVYSDRIKKEEIYPIIHGGAQEQGLRSGTMNTPSLIGFGIASEIASFEMEENRKIIELLRNKLEKHLLRFPNSFVNGDSNYRLFNTSNICFPGLDANNFIHKCRKFAVSNGSACASGLDTPSHVLTAMGRTYEEAMNSIRFSLGKDLKYVEFDEMMGSLLTELLEENA